MEIFTKQELADMIVRPFDGVMPSKEMRKRMVNDHLNSSDKQLIKTFKNSLNLEVIRLSDNKFIFQY